MIVRGRIVLFFGIGIADSTVSSGGICLNISKGVAGETVVRAIQEVVREVLHLLARFIMN